MGQMGQKNAFLQKRTGEVIENKRSGLQNGTKRTGKRSGEVVEYKHLRKKRTGTNPKRNRANFQKLDVNIGAMATHSCRCAICYAGSRPIRLCPHEPTGRGFSV